MHYVYISYILLYANLCEYCHTTFPFAFPLSLLLLLPFAFATPSIPGTICSRQMHPLLCSVLKAHFSYFQYFSINWRYEKKILENGDMKKWSRKKNLKTQQNSLLFCFNTNKYCSFFIDLFNWIERKYNGFLLYWDNGVRMRKEEEEFQDTVYNLPFLMWFIHYS